MNMPDIVTEEIVRLRQDNRELRTQLGRLTDQVTVLTDALKALRSTQNAPSASGPPPRPSGSISTQAPDSRLGEIPLNRTVSEMAPSAYDDWSPPPLPGRPVSNQVAPHMLPGTAALRMHHSLDGIDFGAVSKLTPDELDGLPFGLIVLDREGMVVHYNDTEARMVGLSPDRVIGRSFFQEIAPCTRVREFEGRFKALVANPSLRVQVFDFVFRFAREEQQVSIIITPGRRRGQFNLALVRRAIRPT